MRDDEITRIEYLNNWPISRYLLWKFSLRPQHEALGNKSHKLCSYSSEPRTEVYCFRLTLIDRNWSIVFSNIPPACFSIVCWNYIYALCLMIIQDQPKVNEEELYLFVDNRRLFYSKVAYFLLTRNLKGWMRKNSQVAIVVDVYLV